MNIPEEIKKKTTVTFLRTADLLEKYNYASMAIPQELNPLILKLEEKTRDKAYAKNVTSAYYDLSLSVKKILEQFNELFDEVLELEKKVNPENFDNEGVFIKSRDF